MLLFTVIGVLFCAALVALLTRWAVDVATDRIKKGDDKAENVVPISKAHARLRHKGKAAVGQSRKSRVHSGIVRNTFILALALFSYSCATSEKIQLPSCQHEYLVDKTTGETWCRLCGAEE
jgi:hypothetical protein